MAFIEGYQPRLTPNPFIEHEKWTPEHLQKLGGFNPTTKKLVRFNDGAWDAEELLWNMTEAVEAGVVKEGKFLSTFFESPMGVENFAELLEGYGECFWVNERHFKALFAALSTDETALRTYEDIAALLRERIEDEYSGS